MKIIYLIIILSLISCNSVKIQEMQMDYTQDLIGNIEKINRKTLRYSNIKSDTINNGEKSTIFYGLENRITKQIDTYGKYDDETNFAYNNKLLVEMVTKNGNQITKIEYKYDKHNNVTEYKQLINDTVYFLKTTIYDKKNNPLEQKYTYPKYSKNNSFEFYETDYKKRTVKIQSFDENRKIKNQYLKTYFNKKGYIIETQMIYANTKDNSTRSIIEFDKFGNLLSRKSLNNEGKIRELTTYKNNYDYKGNIVTREKYLNDKLFEKTTFVITYK